MFVLWPPHWANDWSCIRTHLDTQTSHPAWALLPCGGPIHRNPLHFRPLRLALSLARCSAAGLEDLTQYGELLLKNNQSQPTPIFYFYFFGFLVLQLSHKLQIWAQQSAFEFFKHKDKKYHTLTHLLSCISPAVLSISASLSKYDTCYGIT